MLTLEEYGVQEILNRVEGDMTRSSGFVAARATAAQTPVRVVRGTVRDSATGQELNGAIVELVGPSMRTVARSDQRGTFQFSRVADGRYHVSVRLIGFVESSSDVDVTGT